MPEHDAPFSPPRERTDLADLAAARIARRVLEQWWLIALCAIIAGAAAYVASGQRAEQFEAQSKIQVGTIDLVSVFLDQQISITDQDSERAVTAAKEMFNLPNVRHRAQKKLAKWGVEGVAADDIANQVVIDGAADSDVLNVTTTNADPLLAAQITNAMVLGFTDQRRAQARDKLVSAQTRVRDRLDNLTPAERDSAVGKELQGRLNDIGGLSSLSDGNVDVIQPAIVPKTAISPLPKRDALLGLLAGLLLGGGIALLRARLDDRIRDTDELSELWNLPVVGLVPQSNAFKQGGRSVPEPAALESLSLARTNLRYLHVGGSVKTVIVTSALEGEGKSTITWNLGIAAALAKSRVIVVEGDLRRPVMTGRLEVSGPGLSEVLAGIATLDDAVQTVEVEGPSGDVTTTVDFLKAGLVPPSPVALLEGPETKATLAALRDRYDIVLIDTPPATVVADAIAIVGDVDGVVIVSRLGTVRRAALRRLRETLTAVDAPVLGQIVNSDVAAKSYGYYSSYAAKKPFWKRAGSAGKPAAAGSSDG